MKLVPGAAGGEFGLGTAQQYGEADLKGRDFSQQKLQRSNFTAADCRDCDFHGANLQVAAPSCIAPHVWEAAALYVNRSLASSAAMAVCLHQVLQWLFLLSQMHVNWQRFLCRPQHVLFFLHSLPMLPLFCFQGAYFIKSVVARANFEGADLSDSLMDRAVIVEANLK